jgi:hypothetical protein
VLFLFHYQNNFEINSSSAIWWRHLPVVCNNFFEAGVSGNRDCFFGSFHVNNLSSPIHHHQCMRDFSERSLNFPSFRPSVRCLSAIRSSYLLLRLCLSAATVGKRERERDNVSMTKEASGSKQQRPTVVIRYRDRETGAGRS